MILLTFDLACVGERSHKIIWSPNGEQVVAVTESDAINLLAAYDKAVTLHDVADLTRMQARIMRMHREQKEKKTEAAYAA